jgi:hypothetical protein
MIAEETHYIVKTRKEDFIMSVLGTVGKVVGKVALAAAGTSLAIYADYRIKGGPPLRKLYKMVREEREAAQKEDAMLRLKVINMNESHG